MDQDRWNSNDKFSGTPHQLIMFKTFVRDRLENGEHSNLKTQIWDGVDLTSKYNPDIPVVTTTFQDDSEDATDERYFIMSENTKGEKDDAWLASHTIRQVWTKGNHDDVFANPQQPGWTKKYHCLNDITVQGSGISDENKKWAPVDSRNNFTSKGEEIGRWMTLVRPLIDACDETISATTRNPDSAAQNHVWTQANVNKICRLVSIDFLHDIKSKVSGAALTAIENLPWHKAHTVTDLWDVFQVNVREERQKNEKKFVAGTLRGDTQYNNGNHFSDGGNVVSYFIAFEADATFLNKSATEERAIKLEKYPREAEFKQSQTECTPIEEELFIKSMTSNEAGVETYSKKSTKHTNYAFTSFDKRIEIILRFFSRGKYESTCETFSQIRHMPHNLKSEYSVLKDTLINAYQRFQDQKETTQNPSTMMNPIINGYGSNQNQCPDCEQFNCYGGEWCTKYNPPPAKSETPCQWFIQEGRTCYHPDTCKFSIWSKPTQWPNQARKCLICLLGPVLCLGNAREITLGPSAYHWLAVHLPLTIG